MSPPLCCASSGNWKEKFKQTTRLWSSLPAHEGMNPVQTDVPGDGVSQCIGYRKKKMLAHCRLRWYAFFIAPECCCVTYSVD